MERRSFLKGFMAAAAACGLSRISPMVASLESMPAYAPGIVITKFAATPLSFSKMRPVFYKIFYGGPNVKYEGEIPLETPDFGIRPENLGPNGCMGPNWESIRRTQQRQRVAAACAMWDRLEAAGQV